MLSTLVSPTAQGSLETISFIPANMQILSGWCALLLILIHWVVPRIRKMDMLDDGILNSIGGGLALGYVFLHVIPGLIGGVKHLKQFATSNFLQEDKNLMFVLFMFVVAGFCLLYALEKLAHDKTKNGQEASGIVYYSHIGVMAYLSFSIAAMMPILASESLASLILFTVIMGFHFLLEDHAISHHFYNRFDHRGRYVLMAGIVLGWLFGNYAINHNLLIIISFMDAFLAGALILTTIKTEFSLLEGRSHFPTFIASLCVKAAVVFIMLLLENIG